MDDRITCAACGKKLKQVTAYHLLVHGMMPDEYRARFPGSPLLSPATLAKRQAAFAKRDRSYYSAPEWRRKRSEIATRQHRETDFHARRCATAGRVDRTSVPAEHRYHLECFSNIHERARLYGLEVDPELPYDLDGLRRFIEVIGPVPAHMKRPTVGRLDHATGYRIGSFERQENAANATESIRRDHAKLMAGRKAAHGY
jgi:hypothetical protein